MDAAAPVDDRRGILCPSLSLGVKRLLIIALLLAALAVPTAAIAQPLGHRPANAPRVVAPSAPAGRKIVLQRPATVAPGTVAPAAATPAAALPAHPAVVRIYVVEKGSQSLGSGTLVDVRDPY